jgi:FKBP-type peptidyl-prolyl cis-trans isomerase FkpA
MRIVYHLVLLIAFSVSAPVLAGKIEKLPSGVVVTHIKIGGGALPTAKDTVRVHYRGTLPDGGEFDSSYKRKEPISFPLRGVIPCWTEGVRKIQVGGQAKLSCPAATGYGARGVPGVIPPNTALTFEVELLAIER